MRSKKVQPVNSEASPFVSAYDDTSSKSVSYKEVIGYDADGQVVYDVVQRPRYQNGRGFVISYTSKLNEFLMRVSTGSIVRVFLYIAHNQSYGQNGQFGFRCSHKHIEQALRLDRTTVWDALKFLKEKSLINESRIDGCPEFMVNPEYITIGADKKVRVREWLRRCGCAVVDEQPKSSPVFRPQPSTRRERREIVECEMN